MNAPDVDLNRIFVLKPGSMLLKACGERLLRGLPDIEKRVGVAENVGPVDLIKPIVFSCVRGGRSTVV
jgi:hypothetical protein